MRAVCWRPRILPRLSPWNSRDTEPSIRPAIGGARSTPRTPITIALRTNAFYIQSPRLHH